MCRIICSTNELPSAIVTVVEKLYVCVHLEEDQMKRVFEPRVLRLSVFCCSSHVFFCIKQSCSPCTRLPSLIHLHGGGGLPTMDWLGLLKRSFLCLTDGVCRVENSLQKSQLPLTKTVIVGELKEEKKKRFLRRSRTLLA